MFLKQV